MSRETMTPEQRKQWEIDWCWERQSDYDWTQEHDVLWETEVMWAEYDYYTCGAWERDFYRKQYRFEPMPEDLYRYLRNDGVQDWYEICVLKD
jgi:hypothetical protein